MIKLALFGAAGRMGERIARLVSDGSRFLIKAAFEREAHDGISEDLGLFHGLQQMNVKMMPAHSSLPDNIDVILDFSSPDAFELLLKTALQAHVPVVSGTTGLDDTHFRLMEKNKSQIPILYSPNMSPGVNLIFHFLPKMKPAFKNNFDIEIVETHHKAKKDVPSGTALKFAELLAAQHQKTTVGRNAGAYEKYEDDITVHSLRIGKITGRHEIHFCSPHEEIILKHSALNRDVFAQGGLTAAEWIIGKNPGLYTMADVLGLA